MGWRVRRSTVSALAVAALSATPLGLLTSCASTPPAGAGTLTHTTTSEIPRKGLPPRPTNCTTATQDARIATGPDLPSTDFSGRQDATGLAVVITNRSLMTYLMTPGPSTSLVQAPPLANPSDPASVLAHATASTIAAQSRQGPGAAPGTVVLLPGFSLCLVGLADASPTANVYRSVDASVAQRVVMQAATSFLDPAYNRTPHARQLAAQACANAAVDLWHSQPQWDELEFYREVWRDAKPCSTAYKMLTADVGESAARSEARVSSVLASIRSNLKKLGPLLEDLRFLAQLAR